MPDPLALIRRALPEIEAWALKSTIQSTGYPEPEHVSKLHRELVSDMRGVLGMPEKDWVADHG